MIYLGLCERTRAPTPKRIRIPGHSPLLLCCCSCRDLDSVLPHTHATNGPPLVFGTVDRFKTSTTRRQHSHRMVPQLPTSGGQPLPPVKPCHSSRAFVWAKCGQNNAMDTVVMSLPRDHSPRGRYASRWKATSGREGTISGSPSAVRTSALWTSAGGRARGEGGEMAHGLCLKPVSTHIYYESVGPSERFAF